MITLKNLNKHSAQQVFDQVATHLLTQNEKSMADNGRYCAYHAQSGLKCAAGCLIAENEYQHDFEDQGWCSLSSHGKVPPKHDKLIDELQTLHDESDAENWKRELTEFATENSLELNPKIFGAE